MGHSNSKSRSEGTSGKKKYKFPKLLRKLRGKKKKVVFNQMFSDECNPVVDKVDMKEANSHLSNANKKNGKRFTPWKLHVPILRRLRRKGDKKPSGDGSVWPLNEITKSHGRRFKKLKIPKLRDLRRKPKKTPLAKVLSMEERQPICQGSTFDLAKDTGTQLIVFEQMFDPDPIPGDASPTGVGAEYQQVDCRNSDENETTTDVLISAEQTIPEMLEDKSIDSYELDSTEHLMEQGLDEGMLMAADNIQPPELDTESCKSLSRTSSPQDLEDDDGYFRIGDVPYFKRDAVRASGRTASSDDSAIAASDTTTSDSTYLTPTSDHQIHHRKRRKEQKDDIAAIKKRHNSKANQSELLEYMIDAYRSTIVDVLLVQDVLGNLRYVIGEEKYEEIHFQLDKTPRTVLAKTLLEEIEKSKTPSKWRTFLDTLENEGYTFVIKLLKGESEKDFHQERDILYACTQHIVNKLHIGECIDRLYERSIISETDKEDIECKLKLSGPTAATRVLIDKIPRRSSDWTSELSFILQSHGLHDIAGFLLVDSNEHATVNEEETFVAPQQLPVQVPIPYADDQTKPKCVGNRFTMDTMTEHLDSMKCSNSEFKQALEDIHKGQSKVLCDHGKQLETLVAKTEKFELEIKGMKEMLRDTQDTMMKLLEKMSLGLPSPCNTCMSHSDSGCMDMSQTFGSTNDTEVTFSA